MDLHDQHLAPQRGIPQPNTAWRVFFGAAGVGAVLVVLLVWAISGSVWGAPAGGALVTYSVAISAAWFAFREGHPHDHLGLGNTVTLARLAMVASLVTPFLSKEAAHGAILVIAMVAFLLDGVDGWLARKTALTSDFGARFDVEVDSLFALLLAALAVHGGLSPWVLLLGVPRYLFGVGQALSPALRRPLSERLSRKVVCVVQIAVLIFLLLPCVSPFTRHVVAALTLALVVWSFAVDIRALVRSRP